MMICIEKTRAHSVLSGQDFPSFVSGSRQIPLQIFHLLSEDAHLTLALLCQQADSFSSISRSCALLPLIYTPPQVDKFECKNKRAKAVGKRRVCTSLVLYRALPVFLTKKALVDFFRRQCYFVRKDILTYFCPVNIHEILRDQRVISCAEALARSDVPLYGGEQEKNGTRKPEKTKPDKSKRENDKGLKKTKPPKRDG